MDLGIGIEEECLGGEEFNLFFLASIGYHTHCKCVSRCWREG